MAAVHQGKEESSDTYFHDTFLDSLREGSEEEKALIAEYDRAMAVLEKATAPHAGEEQSPEEILKNESLLKELFPSDSALGNFSDFSHVSDEVTEEKPNAGGSEDDVVLAQGGEDATFLITHGKPNWVGVKPNVQESVLAAQKTYQIEEGSVPIAIKHENFPKADYVYPINPFSSNTLFATAKALNTKWALTLFDGGFRNGTAKNLKAYGKEPNLRREVGDDAYFVIQRLFGVNPIDLTQLTPDAAKLVNSHRPGTCPETKEQLGDFYMVDYSILVDAARKLANKTEYVPAPIVVLRFDDEKQNFFNVAILLDQAGRYKATATPEDDNLWEFAKICARSADWIVHELGSHLTLSHLTSEVACLTTYRQLPRQHPIFQLLLPHFFRTLALNDNARSSLVPDIISERAVPFTSNQCFNLCTQIFQQTWNFEERYFYNDLKRRGMDRFNAKVYPFRETAKNVWDHVHAYVEGVVRSLGENLLEDFFLKRWLNAMKGDMQGFPDVKSLEQLIDALTMIIYVASHQHSAVNYFQKEFLSYMPAAPTQVRISPPDLTNITPDDLLRALPSTGFAAVASAVVDMLSDVPDPKHRLCEFSFKNSPHYVEYDTITQGIKGTQSKMEDKLKEDYVDGPAMIQNKNLAQSVLI